MLELIGVESTALDAAIAKPVEIWQTEGSSTEVFCNGKV